jgi:hypothetical protein
VPLVPYVRRHRRWVPSNPWPNRWPGNRGAVLNLLLAGRKLVENWMMGFCAMGERGEDGIMELLMISLRHANTWIVTKSTLAEFTERFGG